MKASIHPDHKTLNYKDCKNSPFFIYIYKKNHMLKKLLLLGCFIGMITSSNAQTLSPGDIAIIGVNYDTSPNYELTIVTLAPIVANTQIRISDYWYNEGTPNTLTN